MVDRLLWVDSGAGLSVGVTVLALTGWLSRLYGLPEGLLVFLGCVNIGYGCYSGSLAMRGPRHQHWINALVIANASWAVVCVALVIRFLGSATALGITVLLLEAAFVGGLAGLEWRFRDRLVGAP